MYLRVVDSPVPKPRPHEQLVCHEMKPYSNQDDSCFPLDNVADLGWSLSEIFGRPVLGTCPFGIKEGIEPLRVCLEAPHSRPVYPSVGAHEHTINSELRCYVLPGSFLERKVGRIYMLTFFGPQRRQYSTSLSPYNNHHFLLYRRVPPSMPNGLSLATAKNAVGCRLF